MLLSAGDLDTTFGTGGLVTSSLGQTAAAAVVQPNGKVVVGGQTPGGFGLARYTTSGAPDPSFNGSGATATTFGRDNALLGAVALVPGGAATADKKVVAVGTISTALKTGGTDYSMAIARFNADGTLDTTFGDPKGKARAGTTTLNATEAGDFGRATGVVVQADGKAIVVGEVKPAGETGVAFGVVRFNVDGTLDPTFGSGGKAVVRFPGASTNYTRATGVTLDASGRIVVAGSGWTEDSRVGIALARLNPNGALDTTFDGDGLLVAAPPQGLDSWYGWSVAHQGSGRIIVAGCADAGDLGNRAVVARFLTDGRLDNDPSTGFGPDHAGYYFDARLSPTTGVNAHGPSLAIQPADDAIVVAGMPIDLATNTLLSGFAALRLTAAGVADASFGAGGLVVHGFDGPAFDTAVAVAVAPDGKIVVAGYRRTVVSNRYNYQFAMIRIQGS